jgi:hypothetical protein
MEAGADGDPQGLEKSRLLGSTVALQLHCNRIGDAQRKDFQ